MKKITTLFAAAMIAASASAQTVTESKTFDNMYFGINTGVSTATKGHHWLQDFRPNLGVRLGRNFTPVFGLAAESNIYFKEVGRKQGGLHKTGTAVNGINTSLLGTVNLTNWVGGYKGEPRCFEVSAVYGLGWGHVFSNAADYNDNMNMFTSKAGLDFAFNLGKAKAWQLYVEPSMNWALNGTDKLKLNANKETTNWYDGVAYNLNKSAFQLNVGLVYKFKNSNGTHNFTIAQLRDQAEIDALNAQINDLRNELAKKPKEVVKEIVKETPAPAPQEVKVENLVFVTFAQGKSLLTKEAKAALDGIAEGKHVQIVGTASPEGSKEINDKLSQARADVVGDYLKSRGIIVDEATGKGVQGTTSNRLAVVYVK